MFSKREFESYVEVDNRESPGITPEEAARVGSKLVVGKGQHFKSAAVKCSHCECLMVLNPNRSRKTDTCPKCDRSLCPRCNLVFRITGLCRSMRQVVDEFIDRVAKGKPTILNPQREWVEFNQPGKD